MTGPYAHAWESYRAAGWTGIIPLPPRKKASPPKGVTGPGGIWPSYADCMSWAEGREGAGNIALKLPPGFLGIDVDDYDGKPGARTLAEAEERWGPLPPTWTSGARTGLSGIRYYKVPEGLAWPGQVGPAIETIHTGHRYALVWPSLHPDTGGTYQWAGPDGQPCAPPDVDQLPELPATWVQGLTGGREQAAPSARNNWDNTQVQQWILERPRAFEPLCARMVAAVNGARLSLAAGAGSHDTTTSGVMRAVRLADDGHAGLLAALGDLHAAFIATRAYRAGATHDPAVTEAEWRRGLAGAVGKVSATSTGVDVCDCDGRLTNAIVANAGPPLPPAKPDPPQPNPTGPDPAQPEPPQPPPPLDPFIEDQIRTELLKLKIRDEAKRRLKQDQTGAAPPRPVLISDLLSEPDEADSYRIEGLWPAEGRVILAAQHKAGKTTLVGNLLRSLVDGDPFLGRFLTHPVQGRVTVLDSELGTKRFRRWIRDQKIINADQAALLSLRGRAATFDILDPDIRTHWANELKALQTEIVVLDCLAPFLDALGLSEDKEAGRFLVAFEQLLDEAGIAEAIVVHHMGHTGERTRGASRLRDWPDAEWRLVREKTDDDDPSARRYFSAYGRDVDVQENAVDYIPEYRRLTLGGGNRQSAGTTEARAAVVAYLRENHGSSGRQIEIALTPGHPQKTVRGALKALIADGKVATAAGMRGATLHWLKTVSISNPRPEAQSSSLTNSPSISDFQPPAGPSSSDLVTSADEVKGQVNGTVRQTSSPVRQQGGEELVSGPPTGVGRTDELLTSATGAEDPNLIRRYEPGSPEDVEDRISRALGD